MISFSACTTKQGGVRVIKAETLKDKIAGGWAGKMIGVTYGAPTEFRRQEKIFDTLRALLWLQSRQPMGVPGRIMGFEKLPADIKDIVSCMA